MAVVTMRQLLEAGVHFGHQTRRWNPKMKRFIFGERNGIYIIDLNQTLQRVDVAYSFVRDLVANGGSVLFIGTKKQSQDPIARSAQACGMPFVNERWLGGMLTNFSTIALRVKKMQEYERMRGAGDFEAMPKKEALILSRELEKLERNLGGIRDMARLPEAIFVIDIKKEHIAVSEANKMGIPIVAVVDTNCDPDLVQYPIPGNDDAIRSAILMSRVIQEAVQEGLFIASRRGTVSGPSAGGPPFPAFEPALAAQPAPAYQTAPTRTAPVEPAPPVAARPMQAQPVPAQTEPAQPVATQPAPAQPGANQAALVQTGPVQSAPTPGAGAVTPRPEEAPGEQPGAPAARVEVSAPPAGTAGRPEPAAAAPVQTEPAPPASPPAQPAPAGQAAARDVAAQGAAAGTEDQQPATTAAGEAAPASTGHDVPPAADSAAEVAASQEH
jgi:small subunit ribosomal protein S2